MATRIVRYVWKIPKPSDQETAQALMSAAYQTAVSADPNVREVLIRSRIHGSTKTQGQYRRDAPHITISTKDEAQRQQRTHQASHGYTQSLQSVVVTRVQPSSYVRPDSDKDKSGKTYWPLGLPSEDVAYNG
ncbi:MAG: hypothetical protein Q9160_002305 [Pyrenula sp. 1 TL-2023]